MKIPGISWAVAASLILLSLTLIFRAAAAAPGYADPQLIAKARPGSTVTIDIFDSYKDRVFTTSMAFVLKAPAF